MTQRTRKGWKAAKDRRTRALDALLEAKELFEQSMDPKKEVDRLKLQRMNQEIQILRGRTNATT